MMCRSHAEGRRSLTSYHVEPEIERIVDAGTQDTGHSLVWVPHEEVPVVQAAPALLQAAEAIERNVDELNAEMGGPGRLCLICFATTYNAEHGIEHDKACELLGIRAAIAQATGEQE
jgi:hypothetical protein